MIPNFGIISQVFLQIFTQYKGKGRFASDRRHPKGALTVGFLQTFTHVKGRGRRGKDTSRPTVGTRRVP